MQPSESLARAQRLHPASLVFGIGSAAGRLLVPGLLVFFAARGSNQEIWLMLLFFPTVVATLIRYFNYTYRLDSEELVIREGLLTRNERHIPYDRIQNIDLSQSPLQRLLGVADVRVETAGGDKPEARLRVLSLGSVEAMRAHVFGAPVRTEATRPSAESGEVAASPDAPTAQTLVRLSLREVLLHGLISNRGLVAVAAAMGAAWQFGIAERFQDGLKDLIGQRWLWEPRSGDLLSVLPWALALLALALVALRLLSMGLSLVRLYGFRLERLGDDLRAEYGLFTRVTHTIPRRRIQTVSVREGPWHRLAGRVSVTVETAGSADGDQERGQADRQWLAPILPREALAALLAEVLSQTDPSTATWQPLSPRAYRRLLRQRLIAAAVVSVLAIVTLGRGAAIVPLILIPLAILGARRYVRHAAWAITGEGLLYRWGIWVHHLRAARFAKLQVLELRETPFDRRNGMAVVHADTAGGGRGGPAFAIGYLDVDVARRCCQRLYAEAGQTAFRW